VFVTAAHGHNCVITPPGSLPRIKCWSSSWFHWTDVPPGDYDPVQLAAGDMHTCVLNRDGRVVCFGEPRTEMTPPAGLRARFIAASGLSTCAIALDDRVVCWGFKAATPPEGLRAKHIAVASNGNFYGFNEAVPNPLTKADRHACAVSLDDRVVCWGDDRDGDTEVPPGLKAAQVAVGTHTSCGLGLDGAVTCWGGMVTPGLPMPEGVHGKTIRAANDDICVQQQDDTVVCWGNDGKGRISAANGSKAHWGVASRS
jgi:alpha-tubulin suppressor-like RCC1 family protein